MVANVVKSNSTRGCVMAANSLWNSRRHGYQKIFFVAFTFIARVIRHGDYSCEMVGRSWRLFSRTLLSEKNGMTNLT